eukprot:10886168-Karenia_brevis.AAC.1
MPAPPITGEKARIDVLALAIHRDLLLCSNFKRQAAPDNSLHNGARRFSGANAPLLKSTRPWQRSLQP